MDRLVYTAMSGAKSMLDRQAMVANNLANVSTPGFRADVSLYRAIPVEGAGLATRTSVLESTPGTDFSSGTLIATGRALDIAVTGKGWIAVEAADGSEAYTRAGSFEINAEGTLVTQSGRNVLGDGGPISIPPNTTVAIGKDGTVSGVPTAPPRTGVTVLGRVKLVDPDESSLTKGSRRPVPPEGRQHRGRRGDRVGDRRRGRGQQRQSGLCDGRHDRAGSPVRAADEADPAWRGQRQAGDPAAERGLIDATQRTSRTAIRRLPFD